MAFGLCEGQQQLPSPLPGKNSVVLEGNGIVSRAGAGTLTGFLPNRQLRFFRGTEAAGAMTRYKLDGFHYRTEKRCQVMKRVKLSPTSHYEHRYWGGLLQGSEINAHSNSVQNY